MRVTYRGWVVTAGLMLALASVMVSARLAGADVATKQDQGQSVKKDQKKSQEMTDRESDTVGKDESKGTELRDTETQARERRRTIESALSRELSRSRTLSYTLDLDREAIEYARQRVKPQISASQLEREVEQIQRHRRRPWWDPQARRERQAVGEIHAFPSLTPRQDPRYLAELAGILAVALDAMAEDLVALEPYRLTREDARAMLYGHIDRVMTGRAYQPYPLPPAPDVERMIWAECKGLDMRSLVGSEYIGQMPLGNFGECQGPQGRMSYGGSSVTALHLQWGNCRYSFPPPQLACGGDTVLDPQSGVVWNRHLKYEARGGVTLSEALRRATADTDASSFTTALAQYTAEARKHGWVREAALLEREAAEIVKETSFSKHREAAVGLLESLRTPSEALAALKKLFGR